MNMIASLYAEYGPVVAVLGGAAKIFFWVHIFKLCNESSPTAIKNREEEV